MVTWTLETTYYYTVCNIDCCKIMQIAQCVMHMYTIELNLDYAFVNEHLKPKYM